VDTLGYKVETILFSDILPIWKDQLWPNRKSPIETHSAMTWPTTSQASYDMQAFDYPPHFFGVYSDQKIIGVNSGHLTSPTEFRSRGLWVDPEFRGQGIAQQLLEATRQSAAESGAKMVWSIPRINSLQAYKGFVTVGDIIDEGVEFGPNIYCWLAL